MNIVLKCSLLKTKKISWCYTVILKNRFDLSRNTIRCSESLPSSLREDRQYKKLSPFGQVNLRPSKSINFSSLSDSIFSENSSKTSLFTLIKMKVGCKKLPYPSNKIDAVFIQFFHLAPLKTTSLNPISAHLFFEGSLYFSIPQGGN